MSFACWQGLSPEQKRYATYLAFRGLGEKLRPKVVSCTINAAGDTLTLGFSKPVVAGSDGFNDGLTLNTDGVATKSARDVVLGWEKSNVAVPESVKTLRSITGGRADLARMSVGLRVVRRLLTRA